MKKVIFGGILMCSLSLPMAHSAFAQNGQDQSSQDSTKKDDNMKKTDNMKKDDSMKHDDMSNSTSKPNN